MKKFITLTALLLTLCPNILWAQQQGAKFSTNLAAYMMQPEVTKAMRTPGLKGQQSAETLRLMLTTTDLSATTASLSALGLQATTITSTLLTVTVPLSQIEEIAALPTISRIEMGAPTQPLLIQSKAETYANVAHSNNPQINALGQGYTGKGIIVGIVDSGFEFGHAAFFDKDGNYRVKRVWNQLVDGLTPAQFNYGTEYRSTTDILNAKTDAKDGTHGTHVASIAAGSDVTSQYQGVATDADIVLVAVRPNTVSSFIVDAVKYIFAYADEVGKPCVINLSLGSHYGPHDGTSVTDRTFDELTGPGRLIIGSAGNEGDYNIHASETFTQEDTQLKVCYGFNNPNNMHSLIDIWGDPNETFTVTGVVVDNTRGTIVYQTEPVSSDKYSSTFLHFNNAECGATGSFLVSCNNDNYNGCHNVYVESNCTNMATNRKLGLIVEGRAGTTIHMWNSTGDPFVNPLGRPQGWSVGNSAYTTGEIGGSGRNVISVGAYGLRDRYTDLIGDEWVMNNPPLGGIGNIAFFSSRGPSRDGRMKPDVTAPGVNVCAAVSKFYFPSRYQMESLSSGLDNDLYYYYPLSGTSMSAPFMTGTIACWLEANPTLSPDKVREILRLTSRRDDFTGPYRPDDYTYGYGKVDVYRGLLQAAGRPDLDGIYNLPAADKRNLQDIYYDLQGHQYRQPQKGVSLRRGQKVLY